jgi:hypothetical protein
MYFGPVHVACWASLVRQFQRTKTDPVMDNRKNWLRIEPYRAAVMAACSPTCDKADVELQGPRSVPGQRRFPVSQGRASSRGRSFQAEADGTLPAGRVLVMD